MPEFAGNVDSEPIENSPPRFSSPRFPGNSRRFLFGVAGAVALWFLGAEIVTSAWYCSQESKLAPNPLPASGEIVMSRLEKSLSDSGIGTSEKGIGDAATEMLKCSYGQTLLWTNEEGPTAVTTLKWPDKSVVSGVESTHNPGKCLGAAGWQIGERTEYGAEKFGPVSGDVTQWKVNRGNLQMLAYSAVFRRFADRPAEKTRKFWQSPRLQPVFDGRRDAPVFIILAYLPLNPDGGEVAVHARFQHLMNVMFDADTPGASVR